MWLAELIIQFFSQDYESNSWGKALFRFVVIPLLILSAAAGLYLLYRSLSN
jgi:hypothetical protein